MDITIKSVIDKVLTYNKNADASYIEKAYNFAEDSHGDQKRANGEPYIVHPLLVAYYLADLGLDSDTIVAGLLHDVVEDTAVSKEELASMFSPDVAKLVDGVTKLGKYSFSTKEEQQVENLRKMIISMANDVRVILIKLCDRLHNMRTLKHLREEKQIEIARESLEIYAPIAHRLGISKIKWELEDLSLRYLKPVEYFDLTERVNKKRNEREDYIKLVIDILKKELELNEIKSSIDGRPKNFYSIYKKMYNQNKSFDEIYDMTAIRVIVDSIKDCYGALGIVHSLWKPIPNRFKDYIATPKPNLYQSLHTTVIGPHNETFEIQIRTPDMHRIAEYGIAAHFKYKEGKFGEDNMDSKLQWIRQLLDVIKETNDSGEFFSDIKGELSTENVYVLTPKGDTFELPLGSTPIDYAYRIHSDVGNRCIGAKVSGKMVPLTYELKNGDVVEIILASATSGHGPSWDWLRIVKSPQAKSKIKRYFKKERRDDFIDKGRDMLEQGAKRLGFNLYDLMKNDWVLPLLKKYTFNDVDDLFCAVGYGGVTTSQILLKLKEEHQKVNKPEAKNVIQDTKEIKEKPQTSSKGLIVKGLDNILVRLAKCCSPVPGDEIIGYITRGRGVTAHRADCKNVTLGLDDESRLIEVEWGEYVTSSYRTDIKMLAYDRDDLITDVIATLREFGLSPRGVNAQQQDNIAVVVVTVDITDKIQLESIIRKLRGIYGVEDVKRT